jgi:hypothetical protein
MRFLCRSRANAPTAGRQVAPGTRVSVIGIYSTYNNNVKKLGTTAVKAAYIKVVGLEVETEGAGRAQASFTPQVGKAYSHLHTKGHSRRRLTAPWG